MCEDGRLGADVVLKAKSDRFKLVLFFTRDEEGYNGFARALTRQVERL